MDSKSDVNETLSRTNPIAEFVLRQSGRLPAGITDEELQERYAEYLKEKSGSLSGSSRGTDPSATMLSEAKLDDSADSSFHNSVKSSSSSRHDKSSHSSSLGKSKTRGGLDLDFDDEPNPDGPISRIVLKFTTISEAGSEVPSFTVGSEGASIGRSKANEVYIESDQRLADKEHALIEYNQSNGAFYLQDMGYDFAAGVRICVDDGTTSRNSNARTRWELLKGCKISIGNSILLCQGTGKDGTVELVAIEGVCKGTTYTVGSVGALLGRSSDNSIAIPDRELSRKHSRIEFDATKGAYYISDCGSTNGTYMLLYGPYGGRFRLSLNDHILVGRTGFSINRFDYGISEEMGHRASMEDSCVIVQHLNVRPLSNPPLTPQSFFGVFDGHGGAEAARYLSNILHVNVAQALSTESASILEASKSFHPDSGAEQAFISRVSNLLKEVFVATDDEFVNNNEDRAHGSTATTVLMLGDRLFCANVGDSRVLLCRDGQGIYLSEDHKPGRPDECKRIKDAGGFVISNRVMGELAVSRAFGDADFKRGISQALQEEGVELPDEADGADFEKPLIIAEPEIQSIVITPKDSFLLLGCDGLFDVLTKEEIVAFVTAELNQHGDVQKCATAITHEAIRMRNSRDNVSVIIIVLSTDSFKKKN
jgi:serine/threonine protein phosphatase PrpC